MKATISWITDNFNKFNAKYFDNYLNMPDEIKTSSRCTRALGKVSRRGSFYGTRIILTISTYYDRSEHSLQETLLHEMIHIYQIQRYGYGDHGYTFKKEAQRINKDGWHISRCTRLDEEFEGDIAGHASSEAKRKMTGKYCGILERRGVPFVFCVSVQNLDRTADWVKEAKFYPITKPETFAGFSVTGSGSRTITGRDVKKGTKLYTDIQNSIGNEVQRLSVR